MRKSTRTTSLAFWTGFWTGMTTDCDLDLEVIRHFDPRASCAKTAYILFDNLTAAGGVTEVKTDIFVTSFGPVSDVEMVRYSCYQEYDCDCGR